MAYLDPSCQGRGSPPCQCQYWKQKVHGISAPFRGILYSFTVAALQTIFPNTFLSNKTYLSYKVYKTKLIPMGPTYNLVRTEKHQIHISSILKFKWKTCLGLLMCRYLVLIGELGQELQTKIFGNEESSFESPNSKSEHIKPFKVL